MITTPTLHLSERDTARWSRIRPYCLIALTLVGLVESELIAAPAVLGGAGILALNDQRRAPVAVTRVLGIALVALATPTAALFLPVVVPELFWSLGFRHAVAPISACFFLCFASFIGHDVRPYGWAVVPLAVGYLLSLMAAAWISQIMTISEQREAALVDLRRSREELAVVSRRAGEAAERSRIAQEVHDGVTQRLVLIRMLLEAEQKRSGSERVGLAHDQALTGLAELRSLLASTQQQQTAPLTDEELRASIESAVASVAAGASFTVKLRVDSDAGLGALPAAHQVVLLHLLREALNNTAQHAKAHAVQVDVRKTAHGLTVTVEDDGVGIGVPTDSAPGRGFGLRGLRERVSNAGGVLTIEDRPGGGTRVQAVLPGQTDDAPDEPPANAGPRTPELDSAPHPAAGGGR